MASQQLVINQLQASNATDTVNFLANKFTSAPLYDWMAGVLNWHVETGRYREAELRYRESRVRSSPPPRRSLAGPTGLGTSAARVGSSLRPGGGIGLRTRP